MCIRIGNSMKTPAAFLERENQALTVFHVPIEFESMSCLWKTKYNFQTQ